MHMNRDVAGIIGFEAAVLDLGQKAGASGGQRAGKPRGYQIGGPGAQCLYPRLPIFGYIN